MAAIGAKLPRSLATLQRKLPLSMIDATKKLSEAKLSGLGFEQVVEFFSQPFGIPFHD
jgi:hypothetical protein